MYGRLDPQVGTVEAFDAPRGRGPYGIATTPGGQVYYASLAGSHIAAIDLETGEAQPIDPPTPGQGARRVWSDSQGRIWVSEWEAGNVGIGVTRPARSGASGGCPAMAHGPTRSMSTSATWSG